ncbi:hypothetical protein FA13DRAFT_1778448 [Coprinellus micaceus]|uniref:Uncharacterized protein n=1 Tax=Coprinellus micaceus TaxID=71717 RepID=A0A4Y7SNE6_COPMI|nr:hypothetical protein FA13DRAFT_1778448 [Coprinellus micaceus]
MWKDVQQRKRIPLPKLHDLALSNLTQQEGVLRYLRVPHCRELRLSDPRSTIIPLLVQSLEGSTSTLKRLNIRDLDIDDWGLLELHSLDIAGNWKEFDTEALVRYVKAKGRSLRGKGPAEGGSIEYVDGALKLVLFEDWLYPELFVRYNVFDRRVKPLRTVKVDSEDVTVASPLTIAT